MRVEASEIDAGALAEFLGRPLAPDEGRHSLVSAIRLLLADAASVQASATRLMEDEPWQLCAVRYRALGGFAHGFLPYRAPRRPGAGDDDAQLFQGVVDAAYRFHDRMLGRLIELAGPDATVMVVSDHGMHVDALRPPEGPARDTIDAYTRWHRNAGIIAMRGAGRSATN